MASTLLAFLACTAIIPFGVAEGAATAELCKENTAPLLADDACMLLCNGTNYVGEKAKRMPDDTACVNISRINLTDDTKRQLNDMEKGACTNSTCKLLSQKSAGISTTSTNKPTDHIASGDGTAANSTMTSSTSSHSSVTTTGQTASSSMTTSNMSTPSNGTMTPPSQGSTTAHANETTTEAPGSTASPSRLLGAANQGVVIAVLALATFGRSS